MRIGLRAKFVFVILITFLALFSVIAFILVRNARNNLKADLNNQTKLFANLATKPIGDSFLVYQDSGTGRIANQIARFTDLDSHITDVAIVNTSGKLLFSKNPKHSISVSPDQAASFSNIYNYDNAGYINQVVSPLIEDSGVHRYNLVYAVSSDSVRNKIVQTGQSILILAIVGLGLSAAITFLLINWLFLDPISKLSRQALAISSGNLAQQISITNKDEIGDLAVAVNKMSESLKADIAKLTEVDRLKTEFMMITSHNLRTPLTIIHGYMDQILHDETSSQIQQPLKLMAVNIQRLRAFTEDMLTISKIESGQGISDKSATKLAHFLEVITKEFKILAGQKKITFTAKIATGDYEVNMDQAYLRSAIWNLLDNALKFTHDGGDIQLETITSDNSVKIIISDSGTGIAPDEMSQLFTKFHRGTSTLKYDYEGTGIGLYATKLMIERHGGTIEAKSDYGHGATFTVKLPTLPEQ